MSTLYIILQVVVVVWWMWKTWTRFQQPDDYDEPLEPIITPPPKKKKRGPVDAPWVTARGLAGHPTLGDWQGEMLRCLKDAFPHRFIGVMSVHCDPCLDVHTMHIQVDGGRYSCSIRHEPTTKEQSSAWWEAAYSIVANADRELTLDAISGFHPTQYGVPRAEA